MGTLPKSSCTMNHELPEAGRTGLLLFIAGLAFLLSATMAVSFGAVALSWEAVWQALSEGDWQAPAVKILLHVRLPRVIAAALCGAGLSVSGVMIQSVLGNPLASPNTIGINGGAGLAVLLASAFFPSRTGLIPLAAFGGALAAALLILTLALKNRMSPLTLILTGFAISSVLSGGMSAVMILYPDAYVGAGNFLAGGLSTVTLAELGIPAVYIGTGLLIALLAGRHMDILLLGGDTAKALGMNVTAARFLLIAAAALLAGAAVSFAGLVGFVGLIVPHAVRIAAGGSHRRLVPLCALLGSAFVILCDLLSRVIFAPYELPAGILLSFLGGPFFIYMLYTRWGRNYD